MRDDAARLIRLSDYRPPDYAIDEITLAFDLDPDATRVQARSRVRRTGPAEAPLVLDGVRLILERIAIDGAPLAPSAYRVDAETLTILAPPAEFTLEIDTRIGPAANTALEGLYVSGGRFCTQCEAEGFRKITYAIDRPDNLARYEVRLEADKARYPTLLSNGNLVESGDLPNGRHFTVWRDPHPKPTYLFAAVAGAFDSLFDTFTTRSGRVVQLGVHVDPGDAARAHYAMDCLKRSMAWDETAFAREYDLDVFNIVAVRDFNFGAMENKGLNVFNSAYVLADPATATDLDYEAIESIVGHEYFHNWTGNRITLRDWFQLCVKEGLTVYRDQEFSADQRSRPVQRIKDVRRLRARQFPEDAGPLAHPVRPAQYQKIDNFYTATVYEKGAEVIRMLRALIGDDAFARGMQLYFERCDGRAVTVEEFVAPFAETSGQDLSAFMGWYAQAGTPRVKARGVYDAAAQRYTLHLSQATAPTPGQHEKRALPIPMRIGFISRDGAILAAKRGADPVAREEHLVVFDTPTAELVFEGVVDRPTPALLRGFTAPVVLDDGLDDADRLAQMAHDPDAFTRWEAGQILGRAAILDRASGAVTLDAPLGAFAAALGRELDRAQEDPAFAALALRLPDLPDLIQRAETPDPDTLHAARSAVRARLAEALWDKLAARAAARGDAAFSADADAAGRRALKTAALDLAAAGGSRAADLLAAAFADARTMTEQIAALEAIGAAGLPGFDEALAAFYAQWRDNPLVLDKWFSAQAAAPRADALARVQALRGHPAFDLKNPNRVRALVAAFTTRNPVAFHAADGSGYGFLAEIAAEVDPLNPALAARLLGGFESWRRFDAGRQAKARAVLEALAARPGLSRNAAEIVTRTLA
ncbi:MAG: aminopeptidase N [Alphaproteobacteria bacterium]|nr:aminopeptidase N [Alphaproteobacteria bacterium]